MSDPTPVNAPVDDCVTPTVPHTDPHAVGASPRPTAGPPPSSVVIEGAFAQGEAAIAILQQQIAAAELARAYLDRLSVDAGAPVLTPPAPPPPTEPPRTTPPPPAPPPSPTAAGGPSDGQVG